MKVLRNIRSLATCLTEDGPSNAGEIPKACLVWDQGKIVWAGPEADLPASHARATAIDAKASLVIPGLIDCHTHLAFSGWRADEFAERLRGASYLEIAKRGGGILSTVAKTRAASRESLVDRCRDFLRGMTALGVTTVECKTGYGLDFESELKLLEVYAELSRSQSLTIMPTLLAAHTIPAELKSDRAAYVRLICERIIPEAASRGLATFCDVFVEESAFTAQEARSVLRAATAFGLRAKLHIDQLSDSDGGALATEVDAISADHLEHISQKSMQALQHGKTVAVMVPIASLYTRQPVMPARKMIDSGIPVAVATDFNPGSAPSFHLPLAMLLACTMGGLSPAEALRGATINAARAIGLESKLGSLAPGKWADFALIDAPSVDHWLYHFGSNNCIATFKRGEQIWER